MSTQNRIMKVITAGLMLLLASMAVLPASAQQADVLVPERSPADVYNEVSPSVVAINVIRQADGSNPMAPQGEVGGGGSGFVIDQDGHIVTNNHVVDGATRIEVNFLDGTLARGEVIGLDPDSDLAVIQVDVAPEKLHPVTFADSNTLQIGQPVLAIGSPFGQRWTLTSGIISALERVIPGLEDYSIGGVIQTDAPINPGNSGGPLFDYEGRVVGVNSQIRSASGGNDGIGFAVPSNLTQRVAAELIEDGYVDYSYLGIGGGDVTLRLVEALDLPNDLQGVVISTVVPGGPAARAGVESAGEMMEFDGATLPGSVDIITAIDGTPITGIASLIGYLARETQPGETVTLSVLRDGETVQLDALLTPRP